MHMEALRQSETRASVSRENEHGSDWIAVTQWSTAL